MYWLVTTLLRSTIDGLLIGSLYALMAIGLTLVYRVTQVANFAHAEYITYGAYAGYVGVVYLHLGLWWAVIVAMIFPAITALVSDELVFKPLWRRGSAPLHFLVASIGIGLIMRYSLLAGAVATGELKIRLPSFPSAIYHIGGVVPVNSVHIIAPAVALVTTIILHILFTRTKLGKAMRATASNPTLARITGINIFLVRRVTWLLSGALAGLSGYIFVYYTIANPEFGWLTLLWIFAAAIMGGFTFYGTIISGIILGVAGQVIMTLAYQFLGISTSYQPAIALIVMVVVLLFKPEGVIRLQSLSLRTRA